MLRTPLQMNFPKWTALFNNDSVEVCPDVAAAIYLISYFEYPINIDSMKELVSFPEYVFCGENNGEKYEYLSKYVPVGDILAKIEMDLKSGTVCRSTVRDHIEYCEKKKYRGIKDIAVMLCTDESQDELLQNYALRYLYEVFGSDCVRNEVVPFASEQLLLQIYHVCRDVPKEPLCKVMQQEINIRCCNDAIERIGQLTRGKFRQPMSLRDVKTVLQRMIS